MTRVTTIEELYNWGRKNSIWPLQFGLACWDALVSSNQLGDPQPAHATKYEISH